MRVTGTSQGVGFRPFVYRTAIELGLSGSVRNDSAGVLIDVEGPPGTLDELGRRLAERAAAARADRRDRGDERRLPNGADRRVRHRRERRRRGDPTCPVSVDTATCADCLAEVDDPGDRRFRYPFTNCTNCGPRYTIVVSVPYDRPATTMAPFRMCAACRRRVRGSRPIAGSTRSPTRVPSAGRRFDLRRPTA